MSEQSDPQQGQSEEVPQPDIDQQFKEYIEELLEVEKAHLPDMPAPPKRRRPPRPEVIREFETRVRQLLNQRALAHNKEAAKEPEEAVRRKMLSQRVEKMTGDYQEALAKWLAHKQATLAQADETSLYRWDTDESLIYFLTRPNKGKAITDHNPYVNWVDIEEFDLEAENYPYFEVPKTWGKELYVKYFSPMHKEVVGKADEFLTQITMDK